MELDRNLWYLIAFFGFIGLSLIVWAVKTFVPNPRIFFSKHLQYPAVRRSWINVTPLQAMILTIFLLANILITLVPLFPFPGWGLVQKRAALASVVNIAPLCIGGRAPLVDALNISRRWYYMAHAWVGAVVTLEVISHTIIALSLDQNSKGSHLITSGWIALGLLLGASIMPVSIIRKSFGRWFLLVHRAVAIGAVAVVFWHVIYTPSAPARVLVGSSCGVWLVTTAFRVLRILYLGHSGEILQCLGDADALQVEIRLNHAIKIQPGCYFYIFFPSRWIKYNFLHSHMAVAFWHSPESASGMVTELTFLLSRRGNYAEAISRLKEGQSILLDGPYGQDHQLRTYNNVVLAAKGIGIASILPLALDMAARRRHDDRIRDRLQDLFDQQQAVVKQQAVSVGEDLEALNKSRMAIIEERGKLSKTKLYRDSVKKVDLFWSLESNSQMVWAQRQLKALQELDPENKLLVVWCGYPCPRSGHSPFKESRHWMCLNPMPSRSFDDLIVAKIGEERRRLAGSLVVTACGDEVFMTMMRNGVIGSMEDKYITFVEAEFQPQRLEFGTFSGASMTAETPRQLQKVQKGQNKVSNDTELRNLTARVSDGSSYSTLSDHSLYSIQV